MIRVGIIGAAGYTAGELIRILINHQKVELTLLQSDSNGGRKVHEIPRDLIGECDIMFETDIKVDKADLFFICKGHGESQKILDSNPSLLNKQIVDLSQDFRLKGDHDFTYGLPEAYKEFIQKSNYVSNPGCFATCIQLGLLPAIDSKIVNGDIHTSGITGSTGAGQKLSQTSHFSWRNNNVSVYKAFKHQHLLEINQTFSTIGKFEDHINFVPYRGNFTRGIMITSYFKSSASDLELQEIYASYYKESLFTHVIDHNPDIKMIVNTNKCLVYPVKIDDQVMVISVIDNLIKGASGQAVQNMNLMLGFAEGEGLNLKSIAF